MSFALGGLIVTIMYTLILLVVLFKFFGKEIFFGFLYVVYVLQGLYIFMIHPIRWVLLLIGLAIGVIASIYFAIQLWG